MIKVNISIISIIFLLAIGLVSAEEFGYDNPKLPNLRPETPTLIESTTMTGNITNFTSLQDTPNSYSGQAGKITAVNVLETGLEFINNFISNIFDQDLNTTNNVQFSNITLINGGVLNMSNNEIISAGDMIHSDSAVTNWIFTNTDLDKDVIWKTNDGGEEIEMLRLDSSQFEVAMLSGRLLIRNTVTGVARLETRGYHEGSDKKNHWIAEGFDGHPLNVNATDVNEQILRISAFGSDTDGASTKKELVRINLDVDSNVSTGIVPGRITFFTADTAGVLREAMLINSSQMVEFSGDIKVGGRIGSLLDVDLMKLTSNNVLINGSLQVDLGRIGISTDTDLLSMSDNLLLINGKLQVKDNNISTTDTFVGIFADMTKQNGITDSNDDLIAIQGMIDFNQSGGIIGNLRGLQGIAMLTAGNVSKTVVGVRGDVDLNGGTIDENVRGMSSIIDQEVGNNVSENVYGIYIQSDLDGTVDGTAYMLYLNEMDGQDFGIFQAGNAPHKLVGNLTLSSNFSIGTADFFVNPHLDRVGIGTVNPEGRLHILGNDALVAPSLSADDLVIEALGIIGISMLTANDKTANIYFGDPEDNDAGRIIYNHADNSLRIRTAGGERMVITSDGDVGIGETTPLTTFVVEDTGSGGGGHIATQSRDSSVTVQEIGSFEFRTIDGGSGNIISARIVGHADGTFSPDDAPTSMAFEVTPDGTTTLTEAMRIHNDGNVGIGTILPVDALTVVGDINISGCIEEDDGTLIGGTCVSGREYKENEINLVVNWTKFNSVSAKSWDWKQDFITIPKTREILNEERVEILVDESKDNETIVIYSYHNYTLYYNETIYLSYNTGFIFEDVERAYPGRVKEVDGIKRVNYGFTWTLDNRNAIQELKKENDLLKARLELIESQLNIIS